MAHRTSLTRTGQVTIPKHIRDHLGLKPYDKIEIYVDGGEVKLRKAHLSLEEIAGILPPLDMPIDEAISLAKEDHALRLIARLRAGDE